MNHQSILDLMQDGQPRTSYEITTVLFGSQSTGAKWFRVAVACDRMVERRKLVTCGKRDHKTVYRIAESKGA